MERPAMKAPSYFARRQTSLDPRRPRPPFSRGWTAILAAGACYAGAGVAAADGIAPGEWKLTETVVMNGQATPAQVRSRCLSPQQAGDTATTFTPEYRTVNSGCERVEFSSTATALRWRMQCTGQMDMDVSGDFIFDTPNLARSCPRAPSADASSSTPA
jgi:hypothetical protein